MSYETPFRTHRSCCLGEGGGGTNLGVFLHISVPFLESLDEKK